MNRYIMLFTLVSSITLSASSIETTESQNSLLFENKESEVNKLKSRCNMQLVGAFIMSMLAMVAQEYILMQSLDTSYDPNNQQLHIKLCTINWIAEHLLHMAYTFTATGTLNWLLLRFYPSWTTSSDFDFIDRLGGVALGIVTYNTFSNRVVNFKPQARV
jgi:hypothetical protein